MQSRRRSFGLGALYNYWEISGTALLLTVCVQRYRKEDRSSIDSEFDNGRIRVNRAIRAIRAN